MRSWITVVAVAAGCAGPAAAPKVYLPVPTADLSPVEGGCKSGCAFVRPADQAGLSAVELEQLLAEVARMPLGAESPALDTLLFNDAALRARLEHAPPGVDLGAWGPVLHREVAKRAVWFSLRLVDEHGVVRAELPDTLIGLGEKKHVGIDRTVDLPPFSANGTWVRVGRDFVWYRT